MPTQINQIELADERRTIFRIEGEMFVDDALLVERLAADVIQRTGHRVTIDLADLDFLDSDAASVLKKLSNDGQTDISGVELFVQSAIDMVERGG